MLEDQRSFVCQATMQGPEARVTMKHQERPNAFQFFVRHPSQRTNL